MSKPIVLRIDDEVEYTLEFNRETVKSAEMKGFVLDELTQFPATNYPAFFFYSFRMHHKDVPRSKTDSIFWDVLGGLGRLPEGLIERLIESYTDTFTTLSDDKTPKHKVELL